MTFEPIAIVGQGCVLPGALTPKALANVVLEGRSVVRGAPAGRFRLPDEHAFGVPEHASERTWSDAGGYVEGFESVFDASGFELDAELILALDPSFRWLLHAGREALRPLGHEHPPARAGLVIGNLSFPTATMARCAESVWLDAQGESLLAGRARELAGVGRPDARCRFMSGLPAHLAATALGLGAGAFALDAACASSLYAIKIACDRLHDRTADLMLAGGVNGSDPLFLHIGFCALGAMSRTGQSRPFHRDADGLVPAEGAALVALERLADARAAGHAVLGVVRGVGLSNDGRGHGLLAPSEEGQGRAIRLAYARSGLAPRDVSLIECHATGTPVGDGAEVRSMSEVYDGLRDVPIGSLKSNLGHLITTAGAAGLMKVLAAFEAGERPPTLHADAPIEALAGSPFRLLTAREPWPSNGPRVAAVSAFGFGGNNAHLLVSEDDGCALEPSAFVQVPRAPIAIVAIGARIGLATGVDAAARALLSGERFAGHRDEVAVALTGLRFPPRDLELALPKQVLALEAARDAAAGFSLPRERTGVYMGMGCDPEVARYGARWRLAAWSDAWTASTGFAPPHDWLARARDAVRPILDASGVIGTMPNVAANRVNSQLDLGGLGFTVSAEQASGVVALELAVRALRAGELDFALVGGADVSDEPVHRAALDALGIAEIPGDAAVVLTLERLEDAIENGHSVLAVLSDEPCTDLLVLGDEPGALDPAPAAVAHAAAGLVHVAAAALAIHHAARPSAGRPPTPWFGPRAAETRTRVLGSEATSVQLREGDAAAPLRLEAAPRLYVYSGADRAAVRAALDAGRTGADGRARLVLVAATEDERLLRAASARRWLDQGGPLPEGVAFRDAPLDGELAFVFTGAAASYQGMGRELALALPAQVASLGARFASLDGATRWVFGRVGEPEHPLAQLWASAFLCQLHTEISRDVLGLRPDATIGYSSGESNALFAMGAWRDLDAMVRESWESPVFLREIVGEHAAAQRAWMAFGEESAGTWKTWSVAAPVDTVREALDSELLAHLTIINTPDDCVVGGEAKACERVIEKVGRALSRPLAYDLAAHCPELEQIRGPWYDLHHRATFDVPGVRFYSAGRAEAFFASSDAAAEAITAQAVTTLDFPRVIERAYADGVRVFVEHGPRGLCSGWIRRILGDRAHVAVPLDVAGRSGLRQLANAAAALVAAGVHVDLPALERALGTETKPAMKLGPVLTLPCHAPAIRLPALAAEPQWMAPAPRLVPVLDDAPAELSRIHHGGTEARRTEVDSPSLPDPVVSSLPHLSPAPEQPTLGRVPPLAAPPSAVDAILARAVEHQGQLAAIHRGFLKTQTATHTRFLALQQNMLAALTTSYASASSAPTYALPPGSVSRAPDALSSAPRAVSYAPAPISSAPEAISSAPRPISSAPRPISSAPAPVSRTQLAHPGPKFGRADLERLSSGPISKVFGPEFADQDGYLRVVRMPMPPLLLADRVTGIEGAPHSMGTGTIWTETDVREEAWYLNEGRMPAGIMIESGQADLLLISWLGIDRLNRGERVYRLLGCELTYHGELPKPGETLVYEIHVDGHAQQGDVRLFFFHYDCRVDGALRLTVRGGQAGFFTDQELADSGGVLWDAATAEHSTTGPLDPPAIACTKSAFSAGELRAFADGRVVDCFGPGYERTRTHVRTPRIQSGKMLFLYDVPELDPKGGPWKRGYLRAEAPVTPEDWTFEGHFLNDPCMPGTLMFEGCLQAMSFYLAAMGFTVDRDGWRFEPVPGEKLPMRCRGQVLPSSKRLTYEVFIEEISAGPMPTAYADVLCTVDGLKAFHARRVGLRLVPGWPLDEWKRLPSVSGSDPAHAAMNQRALGGLRGWVEPKPVAVVDGFPFDYASMLACAWGRPSAAFGPMYKRFDSVRGVARLPGPPYHFISRVTKADAPLGVLRAGGTIEAEYDIPENAWYFGENGHATMPFAVLLEAALQPCGWLASYVGSALTTDEDLLFRNLDGQGTQHAEIPPNAGTLRTTVKLTNVSRSAGMIIESFAVACYVGETRVYTMSTVFGFFPREAFVNQVGLPVTPEDRARIEKTSAFSVDLSGVTGLTAGVPSLPDGRPAKYFGGTPHLAGPMLCMLDRVTAWEPEGGKKGLGWARAEKDVDPSEWFFRCHFFQDPVQPGSLGIEALLQLLQFAMLERGMGDGVPGARFEPLALERPAIWKYRGQVVPSNRRITTEVELLEVGEDARGPYALAQGSLWVDGKRIYHMAGFGMRIVPGGSLPSPEKPSFDASVEEVLDPAVDFWLADHCPTWTLPALPMMSMVDRLAGAAARASGRRVVELREVEVRRWLPFPGGPVRLRTELSGPEGEPTVTLSAWRAARDPALSRFEPVATGHVILADRFPAPPPACAPLAGARPVEDPYTSGALFHGPSFHLLQSLRLGADGASAVVDCTPHGVPVGALHQGLLDALTHAIPHDELSQFSPEIEGDVVGYPYRIPSLRLFRELPRSGEAALEVRFAGFDGDPRFPKLEVELSVDGVVCVALTIVEILLPKGPIGRASRTERRAFLRDRRFVEGVSLSRVEVGATLAGPDDVRPSDWLPGNVACIYGALSDDLVAEVAVRDHVARLDAVHPSSVRPTADLASAATAEHPLRRHALQITREGALVRVESEHPTALDLTPIEAYWRGAFATGAWPVEDLFYGLIERFVGDVVLANPAAHEAIRGRSCLYLANHQAAVESLLFSVLASGLGGVSTVTLAKAEHRGTWVGELIRKSFSYPGIRDPHLITYFDREDRESLMRIIGELGEEMAHRGKSVMVHVEGTRALSCRPPVVKMSSAFVDMALAVDAPIVPVRFIGGLPASELAERTEFPVGPGRQTFWLGKAILPAELRGLPLKERKLVVLDAINALGTPNADEQPSAPDPAFGERIAEWQARTGTAPERAVLLATLDALPSYRSESTQRLVEAARRNEVVAVGSGPADRWLEGFARWLLGRED